MTCLYGIKNCDTVKKARKWLDAHNIEYTFHDLRGDGLYRDTLEKWIEQSGSEQLLNKRSTTWKNLAPEIRNSLNEHNLIPTLIANPTLIKRPVLEHEQKLLIGFIAADYETCFNL
ncbi:MAG: ArsC family reductase [Pseudomonadales bacterium]|nr:ArsC family reductase [Pseudomonadales bacterium]